MSYRHVLAGLVLCGLMVSMVGCIAPGENPQEKRDNIQKMKTESLTMAYDHWPEIKKSIAQAPGYAVLTCFGAGFIPGGGSGYGVLMDNATGEQTYLQAGGFSLGLGIMVETYRMIIVIDDPKLLQELKTETWTVGANAEAVFNFGEFGGQSSAVASPRQGMRVVYMHDNTVALRAYFPFMKFSPYNQINEAAKPAPEQPKSSK